LFEDQIASVLIHCDFDKGRDIKKFLETGISG